MMRLNKSYVDLAERVEYFYLCVVASCLMPPTAILIYALIGLPIWWLAVTHKTTMGTPAVIVGASLLIIFIARCAFKRRKIIWPVISRRWPWLLGSAPLFYLFPLFSLASLVPFIGGRLLARQMAQMPRSAFRRMLPTVVPVIFLLLINMLIISGTKEPFAPLFPEWTEPFYSRSWDHLWSELWLPLFPAYWLGFYLSGERREPASGRARAALMLALLLFIPYGGNLLAWQWSIRDILPYQDPTPKIYDSTWSSDWHDFISARSGSHIEMDFSSYSARYKSRFESEPNPCGRQGGPDQPFLYINWPLLPFHELAHLANDRFDYGDPQRYVHCDYMFSEGTGFSAEAMGETPELRANAMALVLDPGREDLAAMAEFGLRTTIIAREALVFIVHKDNPVSDLSLDEISAVFSGETTSWSEVGGVGRKIISFQQPEAAKSSQILSRLTGRQVWPEPVREFYWPGCDGRLFIGPAVYRNYPDSLGYALRWPVTEQAAGGDLKLLSVNGVAPTLENIENGTYPLTLDIAMVMAQNPAPEILLISQWLTGPEGREFIRKLGFAPLASISEVGLNKGQPQ